MPRLLLIAGGWLIAGLGLAAGIASLALPWGRYRVRGKALGDLPLAQDGPVAVFQVPGGTWYLLALGVLAGLLMVAVLGTGRAVDVVLTLAPVAAIAMLLLVAQIANREMLHFANVSANGVATMKVTTDVGPGAGVGLAVGPLLGIGTVLLALHRRRSGSRDATRHAVGQEATK